jgi:hypothetical protein
MHGHSRIPADLLGVPLLLEIRTQRAPQLRYLLWAAWLSPELTLQPDLQPLSDFHSALSPISQALPPLLLARAESRFDTPPLWDPRFSHLMDERNPHQATEGRLLLLAARSGNAASAHPGPETAALHFIRGLQCFLAALHGCRRTALPEGCFVARSGFRTLHISGRPLLRVVPSLASTGDAHRPAHPPGKPVTIQRPFHLKAEVSGLLLWGAWRGDASIPAESARYLAQSIRADKATRVRYTVEQADPLTPLAWTTALADSIGLRPQPTWAEAVVERTAAALGNAVKRDGVLAHSLKKPYQLLLEETIAGAPLLHDACTLPEARPLPDDDSHPGPSQPGTSQPGSREPAPGTAGSLHDFLARKRDLPLLITPALQGHGWVSQRHASIDLQRGSTKAA